MVSTQKGRTIYETPVISNCYSREKKNKMLAVGIRNNSSRVLQASLMKISTVTFDKQNLICIRYVNTQGL